MWAARLLRTSLLVCAACASGQNDNVKQKYTERVRMLGLTPVYPPREEIQVGDLFVNSVRGDDDASLAQAYVTTVPEVLQLAQNNLNGRVVFTPSAKADGSPTDALVGQQDDLMAGQLQVRGQPGATVVNSLPIAVFPEVTAFAGSSFNLGILAPLTALGLFGGQRTTVTLNFKDVRTYFAPPLESGSLGWRVICPRIARPKADSQIAKPYTVFSSDALLVSQAADQIDSAATGRSSEKAGGLSDRRVFFRLVTRVYLTRSITYTYRNARLLAIARTNLKTGTAEPTASTLPQGTVNVTVNPIPAPAATPAANTELVNAINELAARSNETVDGERLAAFNAFGLTIERVFKQPVAIAFEAVEYDLEVVVRECASGRHDGAALSVPASTSQIVVPTLSNRTSPTR